MWTKREPISPKMLVPTWGEVTAVPRKMNFTAAQPDLFATPGLAGLSQAEAFVTPGEEQVLVASIDATPLAPFRYHEWLGKRLTASYGWSYDFDEGSLAPT